MIGELVPKQFALRKAEELAVIMAIPMDLMARGAAPVVWLLDNSSALIFRLLGLNRESENIVTAEELQMIFAEATKSGVIEESERAIMSGVVRLAGRPVREVMTPRTEVDWLPVEAGLEDLRRIMARIAAQPPAGRRWFGRCDHRHRHRARSVVRDHRRRTARSGRACPHRTDRARSGRCDGCAEGAAEGRSADGAGA